MLDAELTGLSNNYEVIGKDELKSWKGPSWSSLKSDARVLATLPLKLRRTKVLLSSSLSDFTLRERIILEKFLQSEGRLVTAEKADWLSQATTSIGKATLYVDGLRVRVLVRDQPKR